MNTKNQFDIVDFEVSSIVNLIFGVNDSYRINFISNFEYLNKTHFKHHKYECYILEFEYFTVYEIVFNQKSFYYLKDAINLKKSLLNKFNKNIIGVTVEHSQFGSSVYDVDDISNFDDYQNIEDKLDLESTVSFIITHLTADILRHLMINNDLCIEFDFLSDEYLKSIDAEFLDGSDIFDEGSKEDINNFINTEKNKYKIAGKINNMN